MIRALVALAVLLICVGHSPAQPMIPIGGGSSFVIGSTIIGAPGSAAVPSITSTTDQTTGLYFGAANVIDVTVGGTLRALFNTTGFTSNTSRGPSVLWQGASTTVPTLIPDNTSTNTGFGAQLAGNISVINGGVEVGRFVQGLGQQGLLISGSPARALALDKVGDLAHIRMSMFVGDGTGGANVDENYIEQLNTDLHISLNLGTRADVAVFKSTGVFNVVNVGSAAAPTLSVGNLTTGLYSVSTTGLGMSVNGALRADYGITSAGLFRVVGGYQVGGTVPTGNTGTCSTNITVAGGATAGTWTSSSNPACALGGTIILSGMPAATTGYSCGMTDRTDNGATIMQTATSTTSATFTVRTLPTGSIAVAQNAILQYSCLAY